MRRDICTPRALRRVACCRLISVLQGDTNDVDSQALPKATMVGFGGELEGGASAKRSLGILRCPIPITKNGDSLIGRLVRPDSSD